MPVEINLSVESDMVKGLLDDRYPRLRGASRSHAGYEGACGRSCFLLVVTLWSLKHSY